MDFDKMTDKEIVEYINNSDNLTMKQSMFLATEGIFGEKPNQKEAFRLMRKALKEGKTFYCAYDDGESCGGARKSNFDIWIA